MSMPELDKLHTDVNRLKRIVLGDAEEGTPGVRALLKELENELEKQSDEKIEGTIAYRTRVLEDRNKELAIRDSERKWILRGILAILAFLGISGGAVVGNILTTLQQLAQRGTP